MEAYWHPCTPVNHPSSRLDVPQGCLDLALNFVKMLLLEKIEVFSTLWLAETKWILNKKSQIFPVCGQSDPIPCQLLTTMTWRV